MKHFKNFLSYQPADIRMPELMSHFYPDRELQLTDIDSDQFSGIQFLQSEDGEDWYLSQKEFSADTVKIQYNANGVVTAIATDVSGIWPYECSVVELPVNSVPENARADGKWQYNNGVISTTNTSA